MGQSFKTSSNALKVLKIEIMISVVEVAVHFIQCITSLIHNVILIYNHISIRFFNTMYSARTYELFIGTKWSIFSHIDSFTDIVPDIS